MKYSGALIACTLLSSGVASSTAFAGEAKPFSDRLTGDWNGARAAMGNHGVAFDLDSSHYYQGLLEGAGDKGFDYGGRLDAYLNLDTEKLGGWEGGMLRVHGEYFYSDIDPNLGGGLVPTNLGVRLPNPGDPHEWVATNIALVQKLSTSTTLIFGKINTVDLLANHPFFGGGGVTRFWSLGFAAPPNGVLPPVIMGGILSVNTTPISWTFMLFDPEDRTRDYSLDNLFSSGVNASVSGKYGWKLAERTTSVTVTGVYSTKDSASLGEILLDDSLQTSDKESSWHASVQFDHFLYETAPGAGWGVFVKLGASDGNPNPYQGFITGGVGGKGVVASRPHDSFGVGYFYYNISDELQSSVDSQITFDDEYGYEAYYDFAVTPWLMVGADLQYTDPAVGDSSNAWVGGMRLRLKL